MESSIPNRPDPDGSAQMPAIDLSILNSMTDGDLEFIQELAETFITDTSMRLNHLRQIVADEDAEALRREAHAIKGSCGNFGATYMAKVAFQLEQFGADGKITEVRAVLNSLEAEFERVRKQATDLPRAA
ncbi:MAG: Hpt domain-containing protein [Candidatus Eisenbacteria sp.]|nr:Hpt domain-containing protein [Candidatus Eisenbacteria bacterium]